MKEPKIGFLIHLNSNTNGESLIFIDTPLKKNDNSALYTQICHLESVDNTINIHTQIESGGIPINEFNYVSDKALLEFINKIAKYSPESFERWKKDVNLLDNLNQSEKDRIINLSSKAKTFKPKLKLLVKKYRTNESIKEYGKTKYWAFQNISITNDNELCKHVFFESSLKKRELKYIQCYPVFLSFGYINTKGRILMSKKLRNFLLKLGVKINSKPINIFDFEGNVIEHDYQLCPINWLQPSIEALDKEKVEVTYPYGSLPSYKEFYLAEEALNSNLPIFTDSITLKKFIRDDFRNELEKQSITGFEFCHPLRLHTGLYLEYND